MPQQIICPNHKSQLESDGICQQCVLERSKQSAKQFPKFVEMTLDKDKEKKDKKK